MSNRIKSWIGNIVKSDKSFFAVVVLLIGITAYGLGLEAGKLDELTKRSAQPAIVFNAAPDDGVPNEGIVVVASRGGTKYHRPNCPGADTIKGTNLIEFASIDLARAAGYLPAGNCRGLE